MTVRDSSTPLGMTELDSSKPRRQLGLFDAVMLVMGGIVGAGIFANPSEVAHRVHTPFLILGVWVLGGFIAMCGAFIWAELATRLPGTGGQYLYLREAYHPSVAFVYGWGLLLVTQTGGMAAVAVIFSSYFRALTGVVWNDSAIAALVLLILTGINCLGARAGSNVQSALMLLKIGALAALVILGFAVGRWLSQIRAVACTAGFIRALEKHWIRHGSDRFCLWRMANRHFCCG